MFTGPVGPVEVIFYWPEAVFGDFYWPGAIGLLLASALPSIRQTRLSLITPSSSTIQTSYRQMNALIVIYNNARSRSDKSSAPQRAYLDVQLAYIINTSHLTLPMQRIFAFKAQEREDF